MRLEEPSYTVVTEGGGQVLEVTGRLGFYWDLSLGETVHIKQLAWGTVCNRDWSAEDATVACRQLGIGDGAGARAVDKPDGGGTVWISRCALTWILLAPPGLASLSCMHACIFSLLRGLRPASSEQKRRLASGTGGSALPAHVLCSVDCDGTELRLQNCDHDGLVETKIFCRDGHETDAGVTCRIPLPNRPGTAGACPEGRWRLV